MQRKNYFLKTSIKKQRGGFAMIMAITVVVVISTIMALSLNMTSETTKRTTDIYLYEQAILYSKSAAELALLDIAKKAPCSVSNFRTDFDGSIYDANVTLRYVYTNASTICASGVDYFDIKTPEQNGSVLMDITITINDPTIVSEPIRYFRRSIQKL
jgi:hypothetical protein